MSKVPKSVSRYMAEIGRQGGLRRRLTAAQASAMGKKSAAKRWGKKSDETGDKQT